MVRIVFKKQDLTKYIHILDDKNIEILSSGNISIRLSNNLIAIKPCGFAYSEIKTKDISIVDLSGKLVSGKKPSSDLDMHIEIYKNKKKINCILHTHAHFTTVMSSLNKPLKILTTLQADYFGTEVFCMPYVNHRLSNIGMAAIASGQETMLLERHGALIFGMSPGEVVKKAIALEEIAKLNYHILCINKKIKPLDKKDINMLHNYYCSSYFNNVIREP
ncbi:MAG: class II aldolase/adducin family protein [Candidatus ainarchaeum sp.]|nr:class II aldolase/adducin family protein [Candidatus ainarchaeum sp.]